MKHSSLTRFGFTLVEMLTVIAIIGILAALMSGAMVAVRARVQKAAISAEIKQLEMALEAYKTTYGEYPPDGTDLTAVKRHLAKAYPRATFAANQIPSVNPATALVFWLGGPIKAGRPIGFSKNPTDPDLTGADTTTPRSAPLYDFNPNQLSNGTYKSKTGGAPYVYFKARVSANGSTTYADLLYQDTEAGGGTISPYKKIKDEKTGNILVDSTKDLWLIISTGEIIKFTPTKKVDVWYGEKRFQIISPGLDGKYGTGGNLNDAVRNVNAFDNQSNFGDINDLAD